MLTTLTDLRQPGMGCLSYFKKGSFFKNSKRQNVVKIRGSEIITLKMVEWLVVLGLTAL